MTATVKHFDVLDFVDQSKALGVDEKVAKYQARQIEQAIEIAVDIIKQDVENKELATKGDVMSMKSEITSIKSDIALINAAIRESELKIEARLIKWVVSTGIATILALAGLFKYMH